MGAEPVLRPSFAGVLDGAFVLVDRIQPVLAVVGLDGAVVDVVSWSRLIAPPTRAARQNRAVAFLPDRVVVHELTGGRAVEYRPDQGLTSVEVPAGGSAWRYPRLYAARDRVDPGGWSFRTEKPDDTGDGWRAAVDLAGRAAFRSAPSRAIIAAAAHGDAAVVVLQESAKRPVRFPPPSRTVHLRAGAPGRAVDVPRPFAADAAWPRRPPDHGALHEYLAFSHAGLLAALGAGSADAALEVAVPPAGPAVVTVSFSVPRFGPTRFRRRDEPFDELGNVDGCRALGISLAEDLQFGLLERRHDPGAPVVWI